MAKITVTIDDEALNEIESLLAQQAMSLRMQNGGRLPAGIAENFSEWLGMVLERNIGMMLMDRRKTQEVEQARVARDMAEKALLRAASGIKEISIESNNAAISR